EKLVTGVQTCALPICHPNKPPLYHHRCCAPLARRAYHHQRSIDRQTLQLVVFLRRQGDGGEARAWIVAVDRTDKSFRKGGREQRSDERRVGNGRRVRL